MQLRTSNLIMVIKGNHNYGNIEPKDAIKKYMSAICWVPESAYTDDALINIIQSCVIDYLGTPGVNARSFLYDYFECLKNHKGDSIRAWIGAFSLISVRGKDNNNWIYINGFNETNINVIDENTGAPMCPDNK